MFSRVSWGEWFKLAGKPGSWKFRTKWRRKANWKPNENWKGEKTFGTYFSHKTFDLHQFSCCIHNCAINSAHDPAAQSHEVLYYAGFMYIWKKNFTSYSYGWKFWCRPVYLFTILASYSLGWCNEIVGHWLFRFTYLHVVNIDQMHQHPIWLNWRLLLSALFHTCTRTITY